MRILITGGSGLVGQNARDRLSREHQVITPKRSELDLFDEVAVLAYFERNHPDMIIHCAGTVGGIQANIREPVRFLVENFEVGKNVVQSAAKLGIKRLINLGSSCMYPRSAPNPLKEELILKGELEPTNEGYALAKISIQRLCSYIMRENPELAFKTLIPCNLYGKYDKFDPKHSHMIAAVIRKIHEAKVEGKSSVEIWGSGTARREFMYAGDLADFMALSIGRFNAMPDLLNVGLGYDYSIDEYYEAVARVVGYEGKFFHDTTKPEGMDRKLVDVEKLRGFGWSASTDLEDGIQETYRYFLEKECAQ